MKRIAFKMNLIKGYEEVYEKRHDEIWPELKLLLKQKGIKEYSIFLDEETNALFAYLLIDDATRLDDLPNEPELQKWWAYLRDIMETNEDNSPVTTPLREVFYLP
jgi:L-rhamnose mutarotase